MSLVQGSCLYMRVQLGVHPCFIVTSNPEREGYMVTANSGATAFFRADNTFDLGMSFI